MDLFELSAKITLDTSEYERAVSDAKSGFDSVASGAQSSQDAITELRAQYNLASENVRQLSAALSEYTAENGTATGGAQELAYMLAEAQGEADAAKSAIKDLTAAEAQIGDEADGAGEKTMNLADLIKTGLAGGATLAAVKKLASAIKDLIDDTTDYGDNVDKMSQKMGMTTDAYQEWDSVMRHCGTTMESMKASMKTLANAAENGNEAFERLGISQAEIANMDQQQLFEATIAGLQNISDTTERTYLAGQLLGRGATELGALLNHSAEETQAMRDRVHELGIVMSEEAVKDAAAYKDAVQDLKDAWGGLVREAAQDWLPVLTTLANGLADGVAGLHNTEWVIDEYGQITPVLKDAGAATSEFGEEVVEGLSTAGEASEKFAGRQAEIAPAVEKARQAQEEARIAAEELAAAMNELSGVSPGLISGIERFGYTLEESAQWLLENGVSAQEWASQVQSAVNNVVNGFDAANTDLGMSLSDMASNLQNNITAYNEWNTNIQTLMAAAVETGNQSAVDFVNYMQDLGVGAADQVAAMVQDVDGTLDTFTPLFQQATDAGMLAVYDSITGHQAEAESASQGVAEGAKSSAESVDFTSVGYNMDMGMVSGINAGASAVSAAAGAVAKAALAAAKANLAVKSPSRKFRDEVGLMVSKGFALGITDGQGNVLNAITNMTDLATATAQDQIRELEQQIAKITEIQDYAENERAYQDHLDRLAELQQRYNESDYEEQVKIQKQIEDENDKWNDRLYDRQKKALEDQKRLLEEEIEARKEAYSTTVRNLEFANFLIEKNGGDRKSILANLRKLQDEAHRQAEEERKKGIAANQEYLQDMSRDWWNWDDEIKSITKDAYQSVADNVRAFADEYSKAYDSIVDKQNAMRDKLAGFGDLFKAYHGEYTGNTYINLNDLEKQTKAIEDYGSTLDRLKERGVGSDLMQQILTMRVDEATAYGKKLLGMTDSQWDKYMEAYDAKIAAAQSVAERFYQEDLNGLQAEYLNKVPELFMGMTEDLEIIGAQWADAIAEGFANHSDAASQAMRASAESMWRVAGGALGYNTVDFPNSAIGSASAQTINAVSAAEPGTQTINVQLKLNDRVLAEESIDTFRAVAKANPEVLND